MIRMIIIASTNGGVISKLLTVPYFKERVECIVTDRPCGAVEVAEKFEVPVEIIPCKNGLEFSDALVDRFCDDQIDLFISFYKRLFQGKLLTFARGRLINLHPSILPACPGTDGFGDTVRTGAKFIGATIHHVDEGMDTGGPIIQSAAPFDPNISMDENRHRVFLQQCKMLLQVVDWCERGRLVLDANGHSLVKGARYGIGEFAPNLESSIAIDFNV